MKIITLFNLILWIFTFQIFGQYQISGNILDEKKVPLVGANVLLNSNEKLTQSDQQGNFYFSDVSAGKHMISISYVGYEPIETTIDLRQSVQLEFVMEPGITMTDEIVVKATRAASNTPMTYTNIDKSEIQSQNLGQDIPFLINLTPSVVATSDAGTGIGYTGLRIRGSDATRINVTINGIPYNDAESQGTFWVDLPDFASSIENIQIQRGVGTSTNGAAAFGATINIQSTGFNKEAYGQIDNSFGSFNTGKHTIKFGTGLINNHFSVDARLSKVTSDGYIDRASADLQSYFITGGFQSKSTLLKLNLFSGKEITYQSWYGTPESVINGNQDEIQSYAERNFLTPAQTTNILNAGRTYNFYEYENEIDHYQQDHYQLIFAREIGENLDFNTALFYTHGDGYYEQFRDDDDLNDYGLENIVIGTEEIETSDIIRRRWLDNDFYGLTWSLNYQLNHKTSVIAGGGYNNYRGNHYGTIIWATFASNSQIYDRYYDNDSEKSDLSAYVKVQREITDKIHLFGDLQFRNIQYTTKGIDSDRRNILVDKSYSFINPKIGLTYILTPSSKAYISYSIANREPVRSDFIDAPEGKEPTHETLRNVEAGIKKSGNHYNLQANYYLMDYKNQLVLTGELNDVGASVRSNVGNSYRTGFEMLVQYIPNEHWQIGANLTLSRNKIRSFNEIVYDYGMNWDDYIVRENQFSDVDISFSPNIIGGSNIVFLPRENLSLALISKYVGEQFLDNTENANRKISGYLVNDFRFSWTLNPGFIKELQLNLMINNLFDEKYSSNGYTWGYRGGGDLIQENFYYPQAGTNFLMGISMNF